MASATNSTSAERRAGLAALVVAALAAAAVGGRWAGRELNRPALDVAESIDFGPVSPGEVLVRSIPVRNRGSVPLRFVGGSSGCGCLVTELPPPVPPGGSAEVVVTLTVPAEARGRVEKVAELFAHSPGQPGSAVRAAVRVTYEVVVSE